MFFCQRDSFAKKLETEVVSCKPVNKKIDVNGKKVNISGCEVICKDTVIFPEGGGQNTDKGTINNATVVSVTRRGKEAVHLVSGVQEWSPGTTVTQELDWTRRWDNMQQHSGQHLLSAILENQYNAKTLSWWMAENSELKVGVSYIELDRNISEMEMNEVQEKCNEVIRNSLEVSVKNFNVGDPELDEAHTRGLPADHEGPVRVVAIPGVDTNLCCGTHVSNTSQLQMVHLVGTEVKKNKNFLYFLVGGRVTSYLQSCIIKEKALTKILNNAPEEHVQLVDKMQKTLKVSLKSNSNMLKEIATAEALKLKSLSPVPKYCFIHRKDGDVDFINTFLKEIDNAELLVTIVTGDLKDNCGGQLVVCGPQDLVQQVGKRLCEILDGKGGGKGTRFNAKINNVRNISEAEKFVNSLFSENE